MLQVIRSLASSSSTTLGNGGDNNNGRWRRDGGYGESLNNNGNGEDVGIVVAGDAFWPIQPQRRAIIHQTSSEEEEDGEDGEGVAIQDGEEDMDDRNTNQHVLHEEEEDVVAQRGDGGEEEVVMVVGYGGEYDAFAPHPNDFPEMQPFIGLNQVEENELTFRHRVGLTILIISVVFNFCNPLFFIAGAVVPVFSYTNSNHKKMMVYLAGEGEGEVGVFSGKLHKVQDCLQLFFERAVLGLIIGSVLLIIALFSALCAFKWTAGLKRFIRPFLFSGASLGGGAASLFLVKGYTDACNGAFLWYHAESGLYYIVFGTALTVFHTLILYAQVSRYPLRASSSSPIYDAFAIPPQEDLEDNRALMMMVIGEDQQMNQEGHGNLHDELPQPAQQHPAQYDNGGGDGAQPHSDQQHQIDGERDTLQEGLLGGG